MCAWNLLLNMEEVLLWSQGCLSANGSTHLVRIDGIISAEKCRQILIHHAILSGERLIGHGFIFLPDNNPKHTALKLKSYLKQKEQYEDVQIMKWSPQSRDLNIIETLWVILDQRNADKQPKIKRTSVTNPPRYME